MICQRFRTDSHIAFNLTAYKIFRFCVLEAVLSLDKILKGPDRLF